MRRILAALLFTSFPALSQVTSGTITGVVKDPSDSAVVDAKVEARNPATGLVRTARTSEEGVFVMPNLQPGEYTIAVEAPGFQTLEKTGIFLAAADRLNAGEFQLQLGATATTVTVEAGAAELQLQSESGERSMLVTNNQINNLAMNGRNIFDMVKIIPGVTSEFNGEQSNRGGLDSFNINGTRSNQKQLTIDGSSNVDTGSNGASHVTLNPDAIAEVKILTSNYQAEYGKAGGGTMVITTKGGSNEFHANARWFHRHEGLNANNFFNNMRGRQADGSEVSPRALYRYNYAGYQVSGPVLLPGTNFNRNKDKLFFFFGQEYYRQLIPGGITNVRVPTPAELGGDFSQTLDGFGAPVVVRDPTTGQLYPGNIIPESAILPGMRQALGLYPQPNLSGRYDYNFTTQASTEYPRREDIVRVDYQLSAMHRLYGRWINNDSSRNEPYGSFLWGISNIAFPGGIRIEEPGWNASLNLTSALSPSLVNEFTFGPSVSKLRADGRDGNISRGVNGIDLPLLFPVDAATPIPDFSFCCTPNTSFTWSYLGAVPFYNSNTTLDFSDNLTKVAGRHVFKFGIFVQRSRKDQPAWGNVNGQFNFNDELTGHPYAAALTGYYRDFVQSSNRPRGFFRYTNVEWYAQDSFRLTPRLTLDYGLRMTWYQPQYDKNDQGAVFNPYLFDASAAPRIYRATADGLAYDPANPGVTLPGYLTGTLVPDSGSLTNGIGLASAGYPRGGFDSRGIMWEPRFGFAWQMTGDGKTVLRGGGGIMHDRTQGNLGYNPVFENPPNVRNPRLVDGRVQDLSSLGGSGILAPPTLFGAARDGFVPTIYSFSLGIQRELGWGTTMDVSYVGTLSRHLVQTRNLNMIPYGTAFERWAQDPAKFPGGVVPAVEPNLPEAYSRAGYAFSGAYALDANYLRPYPGYAQIKHYTFDGSSNYNSLQVAVNRRFARGLTFGVAYTWSKSLVTANGDENWTNPFDTRGYDYRLASWDRPHVLAFNYVYDLPQFSRAFGGPKWLSYLTDGYQLSGITRFSSGAPVEPELWIDPKQITGSITDWESPPLFVYVDGDVNQRTGTSRFNPEAFRAPGIGVPAPWPRTYMRGGGLQNWDVSLFKNFKLGASESRMIQLRLETFNVFNQTNFRDVNLGMSISNPSGSSGPVLTTNPLRAAGVGQAGDYGQYFGEYTNTYTGGGGPRVVQLGLKVYF